jgi:hypothetical protein
VTRYAPRQRADAARRAYRVGWCAFAPWCGGSGL